MTTPPVTSAADIAAILDQVAPDAGTPLADTPIWDELAPRWKALQAKFRDLEAGTKDTEPKKHPAPPRNTPRKRPSKGTPGSSTRRAATTPQAPTEKVSAGNQPEAEPSKEAS
jgi:hypothetical protein